MEYTRPRRLEIPSLQRLSILLPGMWPVAVVTALAWYVGRSLPLLGAPVIAVVLGVLVSAWLRDDRQKAGLTFASKRFLQAAVVLLGLPLSLREVGRVGLASLPVIAVSVTVVSIAAVLLARWLKLPRVLAILIGVGTMICGASAIAAAASALDPEDDDLTYAVSTIFAFNIAAVLTFPTLGHLMSMSQHSFGTWAGTAINDTSSVVAAATIFGSAATSYAVVVKLARVLLIIPVTIALSLSAQRSAYGNSDGAKSAFHIRGVVPLFMVGFLIAVAANTAGLVPRDADGDIRLAASVLTTAALGAIGMSTNISSLRATGPRPFLYGGALWIIVATACLLTQLALGTL